MNSPCQVWLSRNVVPWYVLIMRSAKVFQSDAPLDERRVIIRWQDGDVEMVGLPWGLRPRAYVL